LKEVVDMSKLPLRKGGLRRRRGFSLVVVLVISVIGMAIMGTTMQLTASSGGSGRMSSALVMKYNILQSALEEGRALLKQSMDNTGEPHRYLHKAGVNGSTPITGSNVLLLTDSPSPTEYPGVTFSLGNAISRSLNKSELARAGIFGDGGQLTVQIYDMQYDPSLVAPVGTGAGEISPEEVRLLPPAVKLLGEDGFDVGITTDAPEDTRATGLDVGSGNAGAYLIRATLRVRRADGSPSVTWSADTSLIQANSR
jgi:hypothetical protein